MIHECARKHIIYYSLTFCFYTNYTSLPLTANMNKRNGVQDRRFERDSKLPTIYIALKMYTTTIDIIKRSLPTHTL